MKKATDSRSNNQSQRTFANEQHSHASEVERRINDIERSYAIGGELRELSLSRLGIPQMRELAIARGIPPQDARRYVQFRRAYTQEELDELFAVFRDAGFALPFTCFRTLVAIKDKAKRAELAFRGVRERRGIESLRRLMEETIGNPRAQGGRRPKILKLDDDELEQAVNREKKRFVRQLRQVLSLPREIKPALRTELQQLLERLQ